MGTQDAARFARSRGSDAHGVCESDAASQEALRGERQSAIDYERQFEATTLIGPQGAMARQIDATNLDVGGAATVVDAREGRTVFPLPARMRSFASNADRTAFVAANLGVDSIQHDERDNPQGWTGSYVFGATYWTDARTGVRCRVAGPILLTGNGPNNNDACGI